MDGFDGALVYAGGEGGLWCSRAGGAPGTWVPIGLPEMAGSNPKPVKDEQWEGIHKIAPDPRHSGRVFVTAYGSGRELYRSADAGASSTRLRTSAFMRGVATDPTNSDVIYTTSSAAYKSGGNATSGSVGVLRSSDGGEPWTSVADGLEWPFGGPVAVDPANPLRVILGSPGAGFFARTLRAPRARYHTTGGHPRPAVGRRSPARGSPAPGTSLANCHGARARFPGVLDTLLKFAMPLIGCVKLL